MTRVRLRILISVFMLVIVVGAIALFIATENVRNAPLTVGSGDEASTIEDTPEAENTPEASDKLVMCESLPGELAYNSNSAGTWDILLMDENMEITNLTVDTDNDNAADFFPSWSFAGTHLNFLSSRLAETALGPSQITLETGELLNMDILQAILITFQNGLFDWDPAYSAGGEKLLWSSLRDLNLEIYTIDTNEDFDIDNATRLTNRGARDWFAAWSPDSTQIIFNSDDVEGIENIYHLNLEDSAITQLTDSAWDEMRAAWSLDGETILYVLDEEDVLPQGTLNLYLMNPDGTEQHPVDDAVFEGGATWTADGRYLVYMSNINGVWQLFLHDTNSNRDCLLTDNESDALYPVWRP